MLNFNFVMRLEDLNALDMIDMVRTLAMSDSRENYMIVFAAKHPLTYELKVNGHRYNPFFGIDLVADVAKALERSQLFATENPEEADNAFHYYCDGFLWRARQGKADICLALLESMLRSKSFRKEDLLQILDMAMEELTK